jgi:hypothetical protein
MLDGVITKLHEVFGAGQVLAQPTAERMSSRFGVEETSSLTRFSVVAFVELTDQIVAGAALDQLAAAEVQDCRATVRLLVDLVDYAMENRHCDYLG